MPIPIAEQIAALERLTTTELADRYLELFGQEVRTRHRRYLLRKLAWRIQALAEGDLSERARHRAAEIAHFADVRLMAPPAAPVLVPQGLVPEAPPARDPRLPPPGTLLVKRYRGQPLRVRVQEDSFEYQGERYSSLSAVAKAITGAHANGFRFFNLLGDAQ
jgi:hypothetical protein